MELMMELPFYLASELPTTYSALLATIAGIEFSNLELLMELPFFMATNIPTTHISKLTAFVNIEVSDLEFMMELPYYSRVMLSPTFNAKVDLAKAMAAALATECQHPVSTDLSHTLVADNTGLAKKTARKTGLWCTFAQKLISVFPARTDYYPGLNAWNTNHSLTA